MGTARADNHRWPSSSQAAPPGSGLRPRLAWAAIAPARGSWLSDWQLHGLGCGERRLCKEVDGRYLLVPFRGRCCHSKDRVKGRAPESGDEVEGSDGAASGGGTSVAELSLDAAHLRKNRVPAGQRWEPSPLDVCPCISGMYGSCMSHAWSGSDRHRGGGSLEVIF